MDLPVFVKDLPLLAQIRDYRAAWLKSDVAAGLSVAAVSLPSAIAYPAIAALPIEIGLFATIFSLVGYALCGPSRQLMVGPDAATCIILAGLLTSLGATDEPARVELTVVLSIAVGILCFVAGAFRLGFLANFLSRPMLVGFLAGISISLIIGQVKRFTGIAIEAEGLIRPLIALAAQVGETHIPTLLIGLGTLAFLRIMRHAAPGIPAAVIAIVLGIALSAAFDPAAHGVAVVGALPQIVFALSPPLPSDFADVDVIGGALAILVVGFGSGIVCARSFAMKTRSHVDADRELFGFGAANVASGLFGGFPVSASDSRTAVNYVLGGKTQLTALVAAATVAGAVLLIADLFAYLPTAILGAILVSAAIDLIDLEELRTLYRISPSEFCFAILTLLGVTMVGVLQGIFIAIAATLVHLLWAASHPRLALLGQIPGSSGLYKLHRFPEARPIPGLTIVVLQSGLVFFNADYVKRRLLKIANATRSTDKWFVLDAAAVNVLDSTGIEALEDVRAHLAARGVEFGIADLNTRARHIVERAGLREQLARHMLFASAEAAVSAYRTICEGVQKPRDEAAVA